MIAWKLVTSNFNYYVTQPNANCNTIILITEGLQRDDETTSITVTIIRHLFNTNLNYLILSHSLIDISNG